MIIEALGLTTVATVVYYIVVDDLNLVGAAKQTAKAGAKLAGHTPNAVKWTTNELRAQTLEAKVQMESMDDEYKKSFKQTYKETRIESNKYFKPKFESQQDRANKASDKLKELKAKAAASL